jgi:phosphate transport system substrate-binding protein
MMKRSIIFFFIFILFGSYLLVPPATPAEPVKSLKGTVRISGAWALYPMMVKWGEEFRKTYPNMRIDISAGGAGKGIADALAGMVDIGMVSRDIRPEEIKPGTTYTPVVKDAVFPTINMNNPIMKIIAEKGIKKKIFNDLWVLGKPLTWGEISGTATKNTIQVYTRSDSCGAAETWAHYLGKKQEDLRGVGVYGDPGLAEAVKRDVYGVGYNNLNYAYDAKTGLPVAGIQIIPIDVNENGRIDPNEDLSTKEKSIKAVMSGVYPSPPARDLYLITKENFKEPSKTFVKWILTEGQKYVNEVGYIKIAPKQINESLKKLEK